MLNDLDSEDWRRPGVDTIVDRSTPQDGAGAIVLMHDAGGDRSQTVVALDRLISRLRRIVAVKTLRADRAADPHFRIRFQHEAHAMAALHHPGIADVYDFGQDPGDDAYLVMARISGQPLNQRIAERGRLTVADSMSIVAQVAHALQSAHQAGIVHRDVKPGNIIIQPDGAVILVDFGIARSARSAALTGADEIVGTAHYISPEQVSQHTVGPAADLYALGAVAYHCLAGHPPFLGDNPVNVAMQHVRDEPPPLPEDVPPQARAVVTTALAKDPASRFSSAAAMAAAAERVRTVNGEETARLSPPRTGHPPPPPGSPAGRPHLRHTLAAVLLALLVLAGAGTALALAYPFGRSRRRLGPPLRRPSHRPPRPPRSVLPNRRRAATALTAGRVPRHRRHRPAPPAARPARQPPRRPPAQRPRQRPNPPRRPLHPPDSRPANRRQPRPPSKPSTSPSYDCPGRSATQAGTDSAAAATLVHPLRLAGTPGPGHTRTPRYASPAAPAW